MIICRSVIRGMRNLLYKFVEKIKTRFIFNKLFPENHGDYEIMLIIVVQPDRPQITI